MVWIINQGLYIISKGLLQSSFASADALLSAKVTASKGLLQAIS